MHWGVWACYLNLQAENGQYSSISQWQLPLNTIVRLKCLDWAKCWLPCWVGLLQTCVSSGGLLPHRQGVLPRRTVCASGVAGLAGKVAQLGELAPSPCAVLQGEKGLYPAKGRCSLAPEVGQRLCCLETRIPNQDIIVGLLAQCTHVIPSLGSCPYTWGFTPSQVPSKSIESTWR